MDEGLVEHLEKINELIDLCIDQELYVHLDKIIFGTKLGGLDVCPVKEHRDGLRKPDSMANQMKIGWGDFPVTEVTYPEGLGGALKEYEGTKYLEDKTKTDIDEDLRKAWSILFWVKSLRALLLEKNQDTWNDECYNELILYLEAHLPLKKEGEAAKDNAYKITLFAYLMELSALDNGEGSYGYAERARKLLNIIYPDHDDKQRKPYDRWIWWNMGIALQHIGDHNQKAVLEFNHVIKKYTDEIIAETNNDKQGDIINVIDQEVITALLASPLEFLLNIWNAIMRRAAIQLRLQLGFHALRTLQHKTFRKALEQKRNEQPGVFSDAARHLLIKTKLMELEAYLQLGDLAEAKNNYEELTDIIHHDNSVEFPADIDGASIYLPDIVGLRKAYHTQLVEFIVYYHLENLKKIKIDDDEGEISINKEIANIRDLINNIRELYDKYYQWVESNSFDKRIYLARYAQALKEIARIYNIIMKFNDSSLQEDQKVLFFNIIEFYNNFISRFKNNGKNPYNLEKYRSDDLPDIQDGLKNFYRDIKKVCEKYSAKHLKQLQQDNWDFLSALDEHERKFGDNLRISALKRCNDRLLLGKSGNNACKSCLERVQRKSFADLLACTDKQPSIFNSIREKCCMLSFFNKKLIDPKDEKQLSQSDYEYLMKCAEDHLTRHLGSPSIHEPKKKSLHFHGLQRWNSLTPAQGRSVGGGYLLYRTDKDGIVDLGIAIDPGFDYIRNLFKMGFSLKDIDIVLISHAHPDHLSDFESIVHLLHELDDKKQGIQRVTVILTLASYRSLEHIITRPIFRPYINPLVIDIEKEIDPDGSIEFPFESTTPNESKTKTEQASNDKTKNPSRWKPVLPKNNDDETPDIMIECTRAYHDDCSDRSDSYGFIVTFNKLSGENNPSNTFHFGYTGDTKWVGKDLYAEGCPLYDNGNCSARLTADKKDCQAWDCVASEYKKCDILLLHLGSLIDHKNKDVTFKYYSDPGKCEELIRKKNHPYLMGMIRFLKELNNQQNDNKVYLLGEFGEELRGGIRTDLVARLRKGITGNKQILPVDVGLDMLLWEDERKANNEKNVTQTQGDRKAMYQFLCALCEVHRPIDEVGYIRYGQDEAIFHVCKTCKKSLPQDVQQNKLRQLYEIGRELKTRDKKI